MIKTTNQIVILTLPLAIKKVTLCLKMSRVRSITAASFAGYSLPQQWTIDDNWCLLPTFRKPLIPSCNGQRKAPVRFPTETPWVGCPRPIGPISTCQLSGRCPGMSGYVEQARPMTLNDKPWHVLPIESRTSFLMIPQLSHTCLEALRITSHVI